MPDNRFVTIQEAAAILNITYMEALVDDRLQKVRVNVYHDHDTNRIIEVKIEASGRYPMVQMSDIEAYRMKLLENK
jgi:hypothetical protein